MNNRGWGGWGWGCWNKDVVGRKKIEKLRIGEGAGEGGTIIRDSRVDIKFCVLFSIFRIFLDIEFET